MRIAFAGNPNSGKTTMYNALTGHNEKVGNWAGVTVDKKEAPIKRSYAGDLELGIPVVVALNKHDINTKKETNIDVAALSKKLGCPVVDTTSTTGEGLAAVVGFLPGLIVVAAIVAVIVTLINKTNKSLAAEYALKK